MDFLQSSNAKNKLQKYLREENSDAIIALWKEQIKKKLIERDLPPLESSHSRFVDTLSAKEFDELAISVANKQRTPWDVVRSIYKDLLHERKTSHQETMPWSNHSLVSLSNQKPIVDVHHMVDSRLCSDCSPKPDDKIIAVSSKRWIVIHTLLCSWFLSASKQKLLEAHWPHAHTTFYTLTLTLTIPENTQTFVWLMGHLAQLGWDMNNVLISKKTQSEWQKAYCITSTVVLQNPNKAHSIINELRHINNDYSIVICRE
jgi:(p)ppGpp synthase/HD superfamily hydrolase